MCIGHPPCHHERLTFDSLLTDPLIRLVMQSDGVSVQELREMLTKVSQYRGLANGDANRLSPR